MSEKKERRVGLRPFSEVLIEMAGGDVEHELTTELAELVRACDAYKKGGSITIKLNVVPGPKLMQLVADIKVTAPRKPLEAQSFYTDEKGSLTLDNPRQADLFTGPKALPKQDGEN